MLLPHEKLSPLTLCLQIVHFYPKTMWLLYGAIDPLRYRTTKLSEIPAANLSHKIRICILVKRSLSFVHP